MALGAPQLAPARAGRLGTWSGPPPPPPSSCNRGVVERGEESTACLTCCCCESHDERRREPLRLRGLLADGRRRRFPRGAARLGGGGGSVRSVRCCAGLDGRAGGRLLGYLLLLDVGGRSGASARGSAAPSLHPCWLGLGQAQPTARRPLCPGPEAGGVTHLALGLSLRSGSCV